MAISYNRLWKLLVDKKMSKSDLRKAVEMSPQTLTKMRRDEPITLTTLERICRVLNTDFGDIVEYIPDEDVERSANITR
ncbi:MAG: helix-turn-helix transcriptional regulator [Eubacteriales bacterium]|nr:helix-turn-helix transcriptional regulator [Eubacteriales bacterium]